jgi:hypothetical protein
LTQPVPTVEARPVDNNSADSDADEQRRAQDADRQFEEIVAADAYGAYVELRRVGTLAQDPELKSAVAGMKLFGDLDTQPVTNLMDFVSDNYELLAEARLVVLFMAARPRLPLAVSALEFPTPADAAAFEPKYRQFADQQLKAYTAAHGPKATPERQTPASARAQKPEAKPPALEYALKRVGRLLIASDKALSLKRLRGEESAPALADSVRFQAARTRFASDSLFVYVDTAVTTQGMTMLSQTEGEQQAGLVATTAPVAMGQGMDVAVTASPTLSATTTTEATPQPTAEETTNPEEVKGEEGDEPEAVASEVEASTPPKEEVAVNDLGLVVRGLWGGAPRMPGAFALGARLDGGALALRLSVENSPDGKINVLPFLPNLVAGPPVTAEAAEVAPADADIFFSTSLDWEQVYTSTLGTASLDPLLTSYEAREAREAHEAQEASASVGDASEKPPTPEQMVEVTEKLFDFKFKEDLIPALGNEVAVSMPFDVNDLGIVPGRRRPPKKEEKEEKEEKDAEPGIVVIFSLHDAEKVQKILPRVLVALGIVPFGSGAAGQAEKREGFEIHAAGDFAYTFINRFLVVGDLKPVRHAVDSYAARRTLAAENSYRDSTGWQAPQKIVQAFVSDALMRAVVDETKKRSGSSTDPFVRALIDQLEAPPETVSFETTNEGDAVVHELRLPVSIIKTYATALLVGARDSHVIISEMMATTTLGRIQEAEATFKDEKKKGRYGTLEELAAEKILEKDFAEGVEYRFELNASGDRFDATATPKEYGKSGRRSFFLDETGAMRAADHKGRPATAADPPVD